MSKSILPVLIVLTALESACFAQQSASAPATTQASRKAIIVPEGFKLTSIAGRSVMCAGDDVKWVQQTLLTLEPATRPTTRPVDLLRRLREQHDALIRQITTDLALATDKKVATLLDDKLLPNIRQFRDIKVPIYFLATNVEKLQALVSGGWGADWFFFSPDDGQLMLRSGIALDVEKPMDDVVLPVILGPEMTPEQRVETLSQVIRTGERNIEAQVASQAQVQLQSAIADFISDEVIVPLKLPSDQQWFRFGICGVLSARYLSQISRMPLSDVIGRMSVEPPETPVKAAGVDLIHPTDTSEMREDIVPHYIVALRRKSTTVVYEWSKLDVSVITKTLVELRKTPAGDGATLVKIIKEATGTDLSAKLAPRAN